MAKNAIMRDKRLKKKININILAYSFIHFHFFFVTLNHFFVVIFLLVMIFSLNRIFSLTLLLLLLFCFGFCLFVHLYHFGIMNCFLCFYIDLQAVINSHQSRFKALILYIISSERERERDSFFFWCLHHYSVPI